MFPLTTSVAAPISAMTENLAQEIANYESKIQQSIDDTHAKNVELEKGTKDDALPKQEQSSKETKKSHKKSKSYRKHSGSEKSHSGHVVIMSRDERTELQWPVEILKYTRTRPSVSFSDNPKLIYGPSKSKDKKSSSEHDSKGSKGESKKNGESKTNSEESKPKEGGRERSPSEAVELARLQKIFKAKLKKITGKVTEAKTATPPASTDLTPTTPADTSSPNVVVESTERVEGPKEYWEVSSAEQLLPVVKSDQTSEETIAPVEEMVTMAELPQPEAIVDSTSDKPVVYDYGTQESMHYHEVHPEQHVYAAYDGQTQDGTTYAYVADSATEYDMAAYNYYWYAAQADPNLASYYGIQENYEIPKGKK